ncbi:MAG: 3-phosphoshikimate 1-carboxyvinyltransferase [Flavobacterium sp.]|jgi:3-phosphoshikimate 1-carboxyvinyltransferase
MQLHIKKSVVTKNSSIKITGSKSETNRLLLLQALYPNLILQNSSKSDDSDVMTTAVLANDNSKTVDIHHAGTAMRFLTAFFAIQEGRETILTGSSRMKERPIKILVDALNQLGANISYDEKEGYPPIRIQGKKIINNKVSLPANVSSQYISALLLIASKLENGLQLTLEGEMTSVPYIKMTLALLNEIGIETSFESQTIKVNAKSQTNNSNSKEINPQNIVIESDWSSASYFYSIVALAEDGTTITLSSYKKNSLQGDSVLAQIYIDFGVKTVFNDNQSITISKVTANDQNPKEYDLKSAPDIAQTIAVTCFGLGIGCHLTGLHTLKIKETDRLEALKTELSKLGAKVSVTQDTLTLQASQKINKNIEIKTYQDHRMAMAFAPLALKVPITINEAEVVSKSFPTFWTDLKAIGFELK